VSKEIETAKLARRSLEILSERLQRPTVQSLDASAQDLKLAIQCLHTLEGSLKSGSLAPWQSAALAAEMSAIRRSIAGAQALLAAAGKFLEGWARLMARGEEGGGNYTSRGEAGLIPVLDRGRLVVHG